MNNRLTELVIKRSEWLTPNKGISFLLNDRGLKCCLGFACLALGATQEQIIQETYPRGIFSETLYLHQEKFSQFIYENNDNLYNTFLSTAAAKINDNKSITNEEREKELIELFGQNNIKLSFID